MNLDPSLQLILVVGLAAIAIGTGQGLMDQVGFEIVELDAGFWQPVTG